MSALNLKFPGPEMAPADSTAVNDNYIPTPIVPKPGDPGIVLTPDPNNPSDTVPWGFLGANQEKKSCKNCGVVVAGVGLVFIWLLAKGVA